MQITDILAQMGGLQSIARELGVSEADVATGAAALAPAIAGGFQKQAQTQPGGVEGLGGLLGQLGGGGLLDNVLSPQPTDVSQGNNVLGQIFGSKDVSRTVAQDAATRTGLDPSLLKKMLPMLAMLVAGYMARQSGGPAVAAGSVVRSEVPLAEPSAAAAGAWVAAWAAGWEASSAACSAAAGAAPVVDSALLSPTRTTATRSTTSCAGRGSPEGSSLRGHRRSQSTTRGLRRPRVVRGALDAGGGILVVGRNSGVAESNPVPNQHASSLMMKSGIIALSLLSPRVPGAALAILLAASVGSTLACSSGTTAAVTPVSPGSTTPPVLVWTQTWSDEFDGPAGSRVDATKWVHDLGDGCASGNCGWGNSEKERYTDATENVSLNGQGQLAIVARPAPAGLACYYGPCRYTSGKITTRGKLAARPGRVEARIKLPLGQGLWPAFWMLGDRFPSVSWPASGELDIMEFKGSIPSSSSSAVHGPGYSGDTPFAHTHTLASGNFADDFHTFAIEWDKDQARFFVDGHAHYTVSVSDLMQKGAPILDQPYFIILNLAVGGHFDGDPRSDSVVPATMLVDYVRVFNLTPQ